MYAPKYTVSVVALDAFELTLKCLMSFGAELPTMQLIITDNGSAAETAKLYAEWRNIPNVTVVRNSTNLGFQEPHRRALDMAEGEYFALLNNDCQVSLGWLDKLSDPIEAGDADLTGPVAAKLRADFIGDACDGDDFDYLQGCCLMGRTEYLREIGLFDPNLKFAYGEDSDLCLRVKEDGGKLQRVRFPFSHVGGATASKVPGIANIIRENNAYLRKKWAHLKSRP